MKIAVGIFCLSLPLLGQAVFAQTSSPFRDGVDAAQAGNHAAALSYFEQARRAGDDSPRLIFNLAVVNYQLGNNVDAARLFRQLLTEPRWADLARYNLGLVALQRGSADDAERWFRQVATGARDPKLRQLAAAQLRTTKRAEVEPDSPRSAGLVGVAYGVDSNVIAFPEVLQTDPSQGEDSFVDLLAYGQTRIGDATRLYAYGYTRRHSELDFLDPTSLGAGGGYRFGVGDWTLEAGGSVGHTQVGGEAVTTETALRFDARRRFGGAEFVATLRPSLQSAGSSYPELDGTMHRAEFALRQREGAFRLNAAYRIEVNDREDLETDQDFFSHSPVRHRISGGADWQATNALQLRAGVSVESSEYRGVNRMADVDGVIREEKRNSDRMDAWLRGEYRVTGGLFAVGEFRHSRQDDTFEFYEYDRNTISVGIEYAF